MDHTNTISNDRAHVPADRFTILRALGNLEADERVRCKDHLAHCYLDKDWQDALAYRQAILKRFEASAPGAYPYGLARTRFFDARLQEALQAGVRQILILGSGFDTRADRFAADTPLSFFEFDRAAVQYTKAQRREAAALPRCDNHVCTLPVDFTRGDIGTLLDAIDIDHAQPVAVLVEGLLYYLPEEFFTSLLGFLLRRAAPGSALVFDYANHDLLEQASSLHGGDVVARFARDSAEPFRFTSTPTQIAAACAMHGLRMQHEMDHARMSAEFLRKTDGSLLGQPFGGFHFCSAVKGDDSRQL